MMATEELFSGKIVAQAALLLLGGVPRLFCLCLKSFLSGLLLLVFLMEPPSWGGCAAEIDPGNEVLSQLNGPGPHERQTGPAGG